MEHLLISGLVLLLACTACAGGNPDARIYIDFDPPGYVHEISPELYTTIEADIYLDQLDEGMESVSFRLTDVQAEYPGVFASPSFINMLPGGYPVFHSPWEEPGTTLVSSWCIGAGGGPFAAARVVLFYLGGSACLEILDNTQYPRWVVDCSEPYEVDDYCVLANGSIGGATCADGDCEDVAVQGETWGAIKSLYR